MTDLTRIGELPSCLSGLPGNWLEGLAMRYGAFSDLALLELITLIYGLDGS